MTTPLVQTTGRRKGAVARARLRPGTGTITINTRAVDNYFPSKAHQMILSEPLRLTSTDETYDIDATLHGGGGVGPGGGTAAGHRPGAGRARPRDAHRASSGPASSAAQREKESKKYGLKKARKAPQYSRGRGCTRAARPVLKFGTDGVPGGRQHRAHPRVGAGPRRGGRARGAGRRPVRRRPRHPALGPHARGRPGGGAGQRGRRGRPAGRVPTPEVAWWSAAEPAPAAMVSASHNPFPDNGIKLFAAGGRKLTDVSRPGSRPSWRG